MNIAPDHIPFGQWLNGCYDQLAVLSHNAGVTSAELRDASDLCDRLNRATGRADAQVIPFPARAAQ